MLVEIKTLADLEKFELGAVAKTFERDLKALLGDLHDRAALEKPRTLTLKMELKPVADDAGQLAEVKIDVTIGTSVPTCKTRTVNARAKGTDGLVYDDLTPDNVSQQTIPHETMKGTED